MHQFDARQFFAADLCGAKFRDAPGEFCPIQVAQPHDVALIEIAAAGTTQARSFSSASAPARDEAGFWPVTSLPSVTTKLSQSAAFS